MIATLFVTFFVLLFVGVPIAFSLGISSVAAIFVSGYPIGLVAQRIFTSMDSNALMAIPFFILAGSIMETGGISIRIIRFVSGIFGFIRGGLSLIAVGASMIFGGVSGSAVADTAAMGSILIPSMKKKKYDSAFAGSLIASSGTIGTIIPPSIPLIVYGVTAGASIGSLFLAGIVPGIMVGAAIMAVAYVTSVKQNYPKEERVSIQEFLVETLKALPALFMPILIIGGILGGIFTATEAGVIACVYAIIVGKFVYGGFQWQSLGKIFIDSSVGSATIMFIIGVSSLFAWIMASEQVPQAIGDALLSISSNPIVILLLINIILLIFGTFMDMVPAMILLLPVLLPISQGIGVDPVHFGIIMTVNLSIGLITPPVGTCLFISSGIAKVPLTKMAKSVMPFIAVMIVVLLLVTYVPSIPMFLPDLYSQ